jgi:hypothetical protein
VHPTRPGGARLRPPVPRPAVDDEPGYADPWAGDERPEWPDEVPAASPAAVPRTGRRAGRRAAAARLRRSRRRILRWSGVAIGACVIAAAVIALVGRNSPARLPDVTSLHKGEFKSVPDACKVLSPATLSKFLPGPRSAVEPMKSSTFSQCSFTLDSKPNFLVLTVSAESFAPFAAASDNGSASGNARDSFTAARGLLAKPAKHSPLPRATIAPLTGLGQHAFAGIQHEHTGGIMREVATVAVLYRNVIITVTMSGQESGGYGPVAIGTLQGDAQTIARLVLKQELSQPTA